MFRTTRRFLLAILTVAAIASPCHAAGPYDDLLKSVTPNTNTLVLINPTAAYNSALGKAQKWAELAKQRPYGSLGFVPPDAELVVISSEINLTSMVRDFQVGIVKLRGNTPNMKDLANHEGGVMDEIAGRLVVSSPRDVYLTTLAGSQLVAAFPADRQYTARWMRHAQAAKAVNLSPYLQKAVNEAGDNMLVAAVDLEDAFDPNALRAGLTTSPVMVNHKGLDLNVLAKLVAGVQGLTFSAKITDTITGTIRIEFKGDPSLFKKVIRDLFLELVDIYGIGVQGLDKWEATYTDKSMTLSGPLAVPDLQRILSLFAFPVGSDSGPDAKGDGPSATATRRYLDATKSILGNLRSTKDSPDYTKMATWHDKAAAQLDQLSRRGVDPIAASAASESARRLRAISGSLRGVPIDVDALSQSAYYYAVSGGVVAGRGGWLGRRPVVAYGAPTVETNIPEVQAKTQKVIADDAKKRVNLWNQIDQLLSDAERKLMDKYKP